MVHSGSLAGSGQDFVGIMNAGEFTAHDLKTGQEQWWIHGLPNQIGTLPTGLAI